MASTTTLPPLGDFAYQAERLLATDSKMSQILVVRDPAGRALILKIAATAHQLQCASNRQAIYNSVRWLERIPPHPGIATLQPIAYKRVAPANPGPSDPAIYVAALAEWPGTPEFVVMDYLAGGTLSDLVRKRPLPGKVLLWLIYRLAQTIAHLHQHGCVHRDLKPENILFGQPPRQVPSLQALQPVLIDFGVAAGVGELKLICGSRLWLAPELQRANEQQLLTVDPAWDIYALGLISCYILSGLRPRRNAYTYQDCLDYQARVFAALDEEWSTQEDAADGVRARLAQLLQQALAQEPASRPQATTLATEVGRLLSEVVGGREVSPQPAKVSAAAGHQPLAGNDPPLPAAQRALAAAPPPGYRTMLPAEVAQPYATTPVRPTPVTAAPAPVLVTASPTPYAPPAGWRRKLQNRYTVGAVSLGLLLLLLFVIIGGNREPQANAAAVGAAAVHTAQISVHTPAVGVTIQTGTPAAVTQPGPAGADPTATAPAPTLAALPSIATTPARDTTSIPTLAPLAPTGTVQPTLASLPLVAALRALPTPSVTFSPTPRPTPATSPTPDHTPTVRAASPAPPSVNLLRPADNEVSSTPRVAFMWESADQPLRATQCFELVFWAEQNPQDQRSPVGASRASQHTVNFATLLDSSDPLLRQLARSVEGFLWGVRVVDCANPRTVVQDSSDSRHYTYQP